MSKLYYPTPDELQGAKPLWEGGWGYDDNRGSWFHIYQELLVRLANTDYGRDLLCIDKYPYPVISMRKNMVQFDMSQDLGPGHTLSDVRVGGKWGNVIRYRWLAVKKALDQMNLEVLLALPKYIIHEGRSVPMLSGASTTTVYPDPHTESTTVDGIARIDGADASLGTVRGGNGDNSADSSATGSFGQLGSSTTENQYSNITRSFTLFDTSAITDTHVISAATLELVVTSQANNFSGSASVVQVTIASNTAVVDADYQGTVSHTTLQSDSINFGSFTADNSTYNDYTLNGTGRGNIDLTGVTKFGGKSSHDIGNSAPTWTSDASDRVTIRFADETGTSKDPKLVIVHAATFVPRAIIF